jgi:pimeloyl-ACP methyl ester carboxylesterase
MNSQTHTLPNGRKLGYATTGSPKGYPVVYFHGTASSRLEIFLLKDFAQTYGFWLIGIDRPGYGLSTFTQRTCLSDFTSDVNEITAHLGLSRFSVLSWSGGGPFALAYTTLNPDCVTRIVTVSTPALPFDPAVAHNNNPFAKTAMRVPFLAKIGLNMFRKSVLKANSDIKAYLRSSGGKRMIEGWPEPDARFFSNPAWLKIMYGAVAEGFRQNSDSVTTVYQEHHLFLSPWCIPIEQIPSGKLILWQGAQDKTCPVDNGQKIARIVNGSTLEVFPNEGHCVMFAEQQKLATALKK